MFDSFTRHYYPFVDCDGVYPRINAQSLLDEYPIHLAYAEAGNSVGAHDDLFPAIRASYLTRTVLGPWKYSPTCSARGKNRYEIRPCYPIKGSCGGYAALAVVKFDNRLPAGQFQDVAALMAMAPRLLMAFVACRAALAAIDPAAAGQWDLYVPELAPVSRDSAAPPA